MSGGLESKRLLDLLVETPEFGREEELRAVDAIERGADVNFKSALVRHGAGVRPLHLAARNANAAMVVRLVEAGAKIGAKMANGASALHMAALNNNGAPAIIDALVKAGGVVDGLDKDGASPLAWALRSNVTEGPGGFSAAKKLLDHGASWAGLGSCKRSPLGAAVGSLREKTVAFMMESGAQVGTMGDGPAWALGELIETAWLFREAGREKGSALARAMGIADALLAAGGSVDDPELINRGLCSNAPAELLAKFKGAGAPMPKSGERGQNGHRPSPGWLASAGRLDRLTLAFEMGLDKEWSEGGAGLLRWAMDSGRAHASDTVEWLLKAGCDPNAKHGSNETPLARAVEQAGMAGGLRVVKMLLAAGARADDPCGPAIVSPLAQAVGPKAFRAGASWRRTEVGEIAKALVEGGADINQVVNGRPLLCHAESKDWRALIELGANVCDAFACLCGPSSPSPVGGQHVDQWLAAGAALDDLIKGYMVAIARLPEGDRGQWGDKGVLSYMEALSLKRSLDQGAGAGLAAPRKPLRI